MYALYPTSEPKITRYATAPMPRGVHVAREKSPITPAKSKFATPAKKTCHPMALKQPPACHFLDITEPSAQLNDPAISASDHHISLLPNSPAAVSFGQSKTSKPTTPIPRPVMPRREIWWSPRIKE